MDTTLKVLGRTDDWVAVYKPVGVAVHRAQGASGKQSMLSSRVRDMVGRTVYVIDPLEINMSGCQLFALSSSTAKSFYKTPQEYTQTFITLVRGEAAALPKTVERPLRTKSEDESLSAITHFRVLGTSAEPRCSLILAQPATARRRQIQRHLNQLSHPILGDKAYGDNKVNAQWRGRGLGRLFLHRGRVQVGTDHPIDVVAPLPADLDRMLSTLPFAEAARKAEPLLFPHIDEHQVIDGVVYDRGMLAAAEEATTCNRDGHIDMRRARKLLLRALDGGEYTDIEKVTMAYIRANYTFTKKADFWFRTQFRSRGLSQ